MRGVFGVKLAAVVLLAVGWSGCTRAAAHVEPDPFAQPEGFDDVSGSVTGTVVDEEFVPLKDAIVGFIDPYQATKTDEAGRFEIGLLNPGTRNLYVIHLGHESGGKRITIKLQETTEVLFVLKVLPVEGPWIDIEHLTGTFGRAVTLDPLDSRINATTHSWVIADKPTALNALVLEANWAQQTGLSGGLRVDFGLGGDSENDLFASARGRAPLRIDVDRATIEATFAKTAKVCVTRPCLLSWSAVPATNTTNLPLDVGVMLDQPFDVYVSQFYRTPVPEGYTLV